MYFIFVRVFEHIKIKNTRVYDRENSLESTVERPTLSYTESYAKKLINTLIENLFVSCNKIILKLIEDDIVIRVDIKSIALRPSKDNWTANNVTGICMMGTCKNVYNDFLTILLSVMSKINVHEFMI